jgi:hypothetical protein
LHDPHTGPDFCPKRLLLQAAKDRFAQVKDAERLDAAKKQGSVCVVLWAGLPST